MEIAEPSACSSNKMQILKQVQDGTSRAGNQAKRGICYAVDGKDVFGFAFL